MIAAKWRDHVAEVAAVDWPAVLRRVPLIQTVAPRTRTVEGSHDEIPVDFVSNRDTLNAYARLGAELAAALGPRVGGESYFPDLAKAATLLAQLASSPQGYRGSDGSPQGQDYLRAKSHVVDHLARAEKQLANVEAQMTMFQKLETKVKDTLAALGPLEIAPAPEKNRLAPLDPPPAKWSRTSFAEFDPRTLDEEQAAAAALAKEPPVEIVGDHAGIRVGRTTLPKGDGKARLL